MYTFAISRPKMITQLIVVVTVLSFFASLLHPVNAYAETEETVSLDHLDDVEINATITSSQVPYIFEDANKSVKSKKISGGTWNRYTNYLHLYNATDGTLQSSVKARSSGGSSTLRITKLPDYGINKYIILVSSSNAAPKNIEDMHNVQGKSEFLEFERKRPLTLKIDETRISNTQFAIDYDFNQEMSALTDSSQGGRYDLFVYEMEHGRGPKYIGKTAGTLGKSGTIQTRSYDRNGKEKHYIALFASRPTFSVVTSYNYVLGYSMLTSNSIPVKSEPWNVAITSSLDKETMGVSVSRGDGDYTTYLVENSTGELLWAGDKDSPGVDGLDNRGYDHTDWVTAYVAENYRKGTTDKPTQFDHLHGIIASSNDDPKKYSGVRKIENVAGGHNPDEVCNMYCTGDPVNNATGEFFDAKEDLSTVGSGLVPKVSRHFSTIHKDINSDLGMGWRTNYAMRIDHAGEESSLTEAQEIQVHNENGSITTFYKDGDSYTPARLNTTSSINYDAEDQRFIYTRNKTKEVFTFTEHGVLNRIENDKNQVISLSYDAEDRLEEVVDTVGNTLNFTYNSLGLIDTITSQNGQHSEYIYDDSGRLITVHDEHGIEFQYTYDQDNRIVEIPNELGGHFINSYDSKNRVVQQIDPLGRAVDFEYEGDIVNGSTVLTYPNGKKTKEVYKFGQLTHLIDGYGTQEALEWQYFYDQYGNKVSTLNPDYTITSAQYDDRGNTTKTVDANGEETLMEYDEADNLTKVVDALGHETLYTYDENNNRLSITTPLGETSTFTYDDHGKMLSTTDPRAIAEEEPEGFTTRFDYTEQGLLTSTTDPFGHTTSVGYNTLGQAVSLTDPMQHTSTVGYDEYGIPSIITDQRNSATVLTHDDMGNVLSSQDDHGNVTSYTYDAVGNMLSMTNALNETTAFTYDTMDNLVEVEYTDGSTDTFEYDIFDRLVQFTDGNGSSEYYEYDYAGNRTVEIDAMNNKTVIEYDPEGNPLKIQYSNRDTIEYKYDAIGNIVSVTDPIGRSTEYTYDANGRIIEEKSPEGVVTYTTYDAVGNTVAIQKGDSEKKHYVFDAMNRQTEYRNEIGKTHRYAYDPNSNLMEYTRPDDSIVEYAYDPTGNLVSIDYPGTESDVVMDYDTLGRKTSSTVGSQEPVEYSYDVLHRIVSQGTLQDAVAYEYGISGNIETMTYPSGREIQYDYDSVGNTVSLHDHDLGITTMQYNAMNQIAEIALHNDVSMSYDYDAFGRLLSSKIQNEEASLFERGYQYNGAEEIIKRTLKVPGVQDVSHDFTYNKDSQIMSQQGSDSNDMVHEFAYSLTGELTAINDVEQEYDSAGKLLSSGSSDFSYDSRNNRTKMENMSDSVEYSWNESNMLSEATVSSGDEESSVQYMYGADGLLVSRSHNATEQDFVWDRNREIPVLLSDGEYEYVYKNPTDRVPFAQINTHSGALEYLHSDSNGSITAVFNDSGNTVENLEYDPYGKPNAELISNFGYAGEWTDNVTGYSFLRARWLDTKTGNFLSEDPMVQVTLNAFGYTDGNPLSQIDPLGLFTMNEFGDWIHENSSGIGITLTTIGVGATMTGLGAPVGFVATATATAVSTYSGYRSYQDGDYSSAIMSASSVIPGLGFLGASLKNIHTTKNLSNLVNAGKIRTRYDRKHYDIPSRTLSRTYDDMSITTSITGNFYNSIKGDKDCV